MGGIEVWTEPIRIDAPAKSVRDVPADIDGCGGRRPFMTAGRADAGPGSDWVLRAMRSTGTVSAGRKVKRRAPTRRAG